MKQTQMFIYCLIVALFCLLPIRISAEECSYKEINRLQEVASEITVSYENEIQNSFTLFFKGMSKEIYLQQEDGASLALGQLQGDSNTAYNGGYEGGSSYTFYAYPIANTPCAAERLRTIYVSLPRYNPYFETAECHEYPDFSLCKKWMNTASIDEATFKLRFNEYKNEVERNKGVEKENPIVQKKSWIDYLIQYYIPVLIGVIVIALGSIVLIKIKDRRDRGDLL